MERKRALKEEELDNSDDNSVKDENNDIDTDDISETDYNEDE